MSARATVTPASPSATGGAGHIITTRDELDERWRQRDAQYAQRVKPLTDEEVQSIRAQRVREAAYIEPRMRGPMFVRARNWRAPQLGEWE